MVEVLQQPEPVHLGQVGVRLAFGDARRDLDRHLFEADGCFEGGLVGRVEPVHQRLLMLLDAAQPRQGELQITIHARAGVAEAQRLRLEAVH
jgi:hypothetical protein